MAAEPRDVEGQLGALLDAGDLERAATFAVERYGGEVLGLLIALHRDRHEADEVFSEACADLWRGLPRFERRSSLRTWFYRLARNASYDQRQRRRRRREVPLSQASAAVSRAEQLVRDATPSFLKTGPRERLRLIREALAVEDQELLILRLDKKLGWSELASVLSREPLEGDAIAREAARLRKRYQLLKERLREQLAAAGAERK